MTSRWPTQLNKKIFSIFFLFYNLSVLFFPYRSLLIYYVFQFCVLWEFCVQMFVCVSTSICVSYAFSLVLLSFLFGCFVLFWFVLIFLIIF